jgi:hypothetical protein
MRLRDVVASIARAQGLEMSSGRAPVSPVALHVRAWPCMSARGPACPRVALHVRAGLAVQFNAIPMQFQCNSMQFQCNSMQFQCNSVSVPPSRFGAAGLFPRRGSARRVCSTVAVRRGGSVRLWRFVAAFLHVRAGLAVQFNAIPMQFQCNSNAIPCLFPRRGSARRSGSEMRCNSNAIPMQLQCFSSVAVRRGGTV